MDGVEGRLLSKGFCVCVGWWWRVGCWRAQGQGIKKQQGRAGQGSTVRTMLLVKAGVANALWKGAMSARAFQGEVMDDDEHKDKRETSKAGQYSRVAASVWRMSAHGVQALTGTVCPWRWFGQTQCSRHKLWCTTWCTAATHATFLLTSQHVPMHHPEQWLLVTLTATITPVTGLAQQQLAIGCARKQGDTTQHQQQQVCSGSSSSSDGGINITSWVAPFDVPYRS
jgi:hypothetical protein